MFQTFQFNEFGGGLNLREQPADLADNELVEARNVELDERRAIRSRPGTTLIAQAGLASAKTTSIYHFQRSDGTDCVLLTGGAKVYRMAAGGGGGMTDITGITVLPSNTEWHWVTFNNKALGVNGATSGDNPVQVVDTSTNAQKMGGTPPYGSQIAVWNSRVFIVDATAPNVLKWCKLGDETDWTTPGIIGAGSWNIGGNEGAGITGLKVFKQALFIFKRNRIYVMSGGSPNTDSSQWQVDLFADNVGCVAPRTIHEVLNDVVFLSDKGVISLQGAAELGNLRQGELSAKLPVLAELSRTTTKYAAIVLPDRRQYWLSVPYSPTASVNETVWVMDFSRLSEGGGVVWTRFDGAVASECYGVVYESGQPRLYIGEVGVGSVGAYRYADPGVWTDVDDVHPRIEVRTKAFDFGTKLDRKDFLRFGVEIETEGTIAQVLVDYRIDEDDLRRKTFRHDVDPRTAGALYDEALWDTATYGGVENLTVSAFHRIGGITGRRGKTIQFIFRNIKQFPLSLVSQIILRGLRVEAAQLSWLRDNDPGVAV